MNIRNALRTGLFCKNMHDVWDARCLHPLELCIQVHHALCSAVKHFSSAAFLACENSRPSLLPAREDVFLWKSWKSLGVSLSCLGFLWCKKAEHNFDKRAARGGKREEEKPTGGQQKTELLQNASESTREIQICILDEFDRDMVLMPCDKTQLAWFDQEFYDIKSVSGQPREIFLVVRW